MTTRPRLWILSGERLDKLSLGPMVRYLEMAKEAVRSGFDVNICLDGCSQALPDGIQYRKLAPSTISEIEVGDRIVARITIPPAILRRLLDSNLAFDVDFYSVAATEGLESDNAMPRRRLFQGRRRTMLRYRILVEHARKILVSIPEHEMFLGGVLFSRGNRHSCQIASRLPEKCLLAPMGVSGAPFPVDVPNPYPETLRDRPIFLWGGGIWAWFDVETLFQAFSLLKAKDSPAALFFLCGSNPSGLSSQDEPARKAYARATELGLVGRNVFFLDHGVANNVLPGYLAHCTAGIMANFEHMESLCSWRTRLLDLLWSRKPVIACGYDPLSTAMSRNGLGVVTPSGDPRALAEAISAFQPESLQGAELAGSLAWSKVFADWIVSLQEPFPFRKERPSRFFWLRYLLGI